MKEYRLRLTKGSDIWGTMRHLMEMIVSGLDLGPVVVILTRDKRSNEQNAKLWPMLTDIQRSLPEWHGVGMGKEDYKDMLSGSFRSCRVVPNSDSTGFVTVGMSTSKMTKSQFSEFIEFIYAFGAEKGVSWSEVSVGIYEEYRQAA